MNFISLQYLFFLVSVFAVYWILGKKWKLQNLLLLICSYIFYGCWDIKCLLLIFATTLCSYTCAIICRKYTLWINVIVNIGILGMFKYYDFFATSFMTLMNTSDETHFIPILHLILPVGISFYTFQALGYTFDVYNKRLEPCRDFITYAAYISFFPQLVAGPIESAPRLLPQFNQKRTFTYAEGAEGLRQILLGLFKKMVIADNCAESVDAIFGNYQAQSSCVLLIGALLFTFQIYGDFSGYSDIARGSARLFGIDLTQNFLSPYFSSSIREFWQRWHISLQSWFRCYIYIPLGGSRCSQRRYFFNVLIVFGLSGLWHGAAWTFVVWGLYHAALYILSTQIKISANNIASRLLTFLGVMIGWIVFRSDTISDACGYIQRMLSCQSLTTIPIPPFATFAAIAMISTILLLLCEYLTLNKAYTTCIFNSIPHVLRPWIYILITLSIITLGGTPSEFVYFQF